MVSNARFCITSWRDVSVVYGHAMPCAPTFLKLDDVEWNRLAAPIYSRQHGKSVPVPGGGPPTLCE